MISPDCLTLQYLRCIRTNIKYGDCDNWNENNSQDQLHFF